MRDRQFDHIIKNKLSGFVSPATPDWELFKAKKVLADADGTSNPFDTTIKATLAGYQTTSEPQWSAFQDFKNKLQDKPSESGFDSEVKAKLEGLESPSTPQWAAFQDFRSNAPSEADTNFDENIKTRLEGYESNAEPQWAAFTDYKINRDINADDDNFDARIQDELEGYETTTEPSWPAFLDARFDFRVEGVLETYTPTSSPNWQAYLDRKFDSVIDAKVGESETSSAPQWEKFLKKKREDEGVIADASFDKSVFGRLGQKKVRYNSEHWLMLKDRLQKIAYLRKQIFSYKTLEMVFVSLLLFTIGNHFFMFQGDQVAAEAPMLVEQQNSVEKAATDNTDLFTKEVETRQDVVLVETDISSDIPSLSSASSGNSKAEKSNQGTVDSGSSGAESSESRSRGLSDISTANDALATTTQAERASSTTIADKATVTTAKEIDRALIANLDEILFSNDLALLDHEREIPETAKAKYINLNKKKSYKNEGLWVHVVNSMDNNYITTPDNLEIGLPEKTHEKFAYHGEIIISKAFKRWELETGLGYSFLNYEPYDAGVITYFAQNRLREVDFKKMNLDLIHIPLNAKYHFVQNGRWSIFAGAGLSNDFIAKTAYDIEDIKEGGPTVGQGQDPLPDELPPFYSREFTEGFFGNAPELPTFVDYKTKSNNYLLRGTLSLGAERNISDNFAAYIRTTYYHALYNTEIGPYNDKIHKMNFGMGFKLRLK